MYIAIEGCIGSGKTTLAKSLSKQYSARILLESTEKHPFIIDFYLNPYDFAFQTEMSFVLIHYHQLQKAKQDSLFDNEVIGDFLFDKDLIFASLNLKNPIELNLFKSTFKLLKQRIPEPDIVIYLRAPTDFLYKRIMQRGRDFERDIPLKYLENLNERYDKFFSNYNETKKIILNATCLDYHNNEDFLEEVVNRVNTSIKMI